MAAIGATSERPRLCDEAAVTRCPLCDPSLLEQPRRMWGSYQNCAQHDKERAMAVQRLTEQAAIPPAAAPKRSIYDRFWDASRLLVVRGGTFTDAQEKAFGAKADELIALYEAEHPGKQSPGLRFGPGDPSRLEFVWPAGWARDAGWPR